MSRLVTLPAMPLPCIPEISMPCSAAILRTSGDDLVRRRSSNEFPFPPAGGNGNSFEERLRTKSSPLVRKIAAEHGIEISGMQGSGIAGRVTKRDILQYLESGAPAAATRPSMHAPGGASPSGLTVEAWPGDAV